MSDELTSRYCWFFQDEIHVDGIPTDMPNSELYRILTYLFGKAGPIKVTYLKQIDLYLIKITICSFIFQLNQAKQKPSIFLSKGRATIIYEKEYSVNEAIQKYDGFIQEYLSLYHCFSQYFRTNYRFVEKF